MASSREFGSLRHLAGRFVGSLLPHGPEPAGERWAGDHLLARERDLWSRLSGADRRHAVGVARRAVAELGGPDATAPVRREVVAAALLHDVGKAEARIGTWGRAGVTVAAMAIGREQLVAWSGAAVPAEPGSGPAGCRAWRRRIGLYLGHDRVGADLLTKAGSDPLTIAWAGEHHRSSDRWTIDENLGAALKMADDD